MFRRTFASRSRRPRPAVPVVMLLSAVVSCAPWTSIPAPGPAALPPANQVQVWIGGRGIVLREVNITADSVHGRAVDPLGRATWVALARAEVDSFQIRPPDRANWFGAGVGGGLLVGVVGALAFCRAVAGD